MHIPPAFLTISQAAQRLKISTKTLRRWEHDGKLIPSRDIHNNRVYTVGAIQKMLHELATNNGTGYVSINTASEILNVTTKTIRRYIKAQQLAPLVKNGRYLFNIRELNDLAALRANLPTYIHRNFSPSGDLNHFASLSIGAAVVLIGTVANVLAVPQSRYSESTKLAERAQSNIVSQLLGERTTYPLPASADTISLHHQTHFRSEGNQNVSINNNSNQYHINNLNSNHRFVINLPPFAARILLPSSSVLSSPLRTLPTDTNNLPNLKTSPTSVQATSQGIQGLPLSLSTNQAIPGSVTLTPVLNSKLIKESATTESYQALFPGSAAKTAPLPLPTASFIPSLNALGELETH